MINPCNLFVTIPDLSLSYLRMIVQPLTNPKPIPDLNPLNKGNAPVIQRRPRSGSHGNLQKDQRIFPESRPVTVREAA